MRKTMRRTRTRNYNRVGKNIYCYTLANGHKSYRVRKFVKGTMLTATFHTLKDCKNWLSTLTTPTTPIKLVKRLKP